MLNLKGNRRATRVLTFTMPDGREVVKRHKITNSTSCDYDFVVVSRSSEDREWSAYSWSRYEQTAQADARDLRSAMGKEGEVVVLPLQNWIENAPESWRRWAPVRTVAP